MVGDDLEHLQCIAAATNCVLHCALQVEESTTKDTEDDWIVNEPVGLNWDMQVESLVISDDDEEYRPGAKNIDQLQVGRDVIQLTGSAILSDLQITSQNADLATATVQFTGTGALS